MDNGRRGFLGVHARFRGFMYDTHYSRVKLVSGHLPMTGFEDPPKPQSLNQIK